MVKYRAELEAVRQEEIQRKEAEMKYPPESSDEPLVPEIRKKIGGIGSRLRWTFKVLDEKKIPRKYLLVDYPKIRQSLRIGIREIPGLEIYKEEQVTL